MVTKRKVLQATIPAAVMAVLTASVITAQRPQSPGNSAQAAGPTGDAQAQRQAQGQKKGITAAQKANVQERVTLATAILDAHAADAKAQGLASGWRQPLMEGLLALPVNSLRKVQASRSLEELTTAIAAESSDPTVIGSSTQDLVFTPIAPCRFIDTRNIGGRINGFRGYDLILTGASYGGSGACNPTAQFGVSQNGFGALAMNLTIIDPLGAPGFAAIKPTQAAPTSSLVNWYQAGPTVAVANQGILIMDQSSAASEFFVQTSDPVHVFIDIFGAFLPPEATALDCLSPISQQASYALANGTTSGFLYSLSCPAPYTLTGGACYASSDPVYLLANGTSSNELQWFCKFNNLSGVSTTINVWARCCRVPGR